MPGQRTHESEPTQPPLRLTLFSDTGDRFGTSEEVEWAEFIETEHEIKGEPPDGKNKALLDQQKDGIAVMLGRLKDGTARGKKNVTSVCAIGLDFDARSDDELYEGLGKLAAYRWWAYTTHKHHAECIGHQPRVRVILPLARECDLETAEATWRTLAALVGKLPAGPVDPKCSDATRLHFLPSTFDADLCWSLPNEGVAFEPTPPDRAPKKVSPRRVASETEQVVSWLRRLSKTHPSKAAATALTRGEPFAEPGERHDTMLGLTWSIAEKFDDLTEDHIATLFAKSLEAMGFEPTIEAAQSAYETALEKIEAYRDAEDEKARQKRLMDAQKVQAQNANRSGPYDDDEIEAIAAAHGWDPDDLDDRWLIQRQGAVWMLGETGRYHGPYTATDAPVAASKILARAPVRMVAIGPNGGQQYRAMNDFVRESGQVAERVIASLSAQRHEFDPDTGTFTEACTPIRRNKLEPRHDPQIEEWVRILAGDEQEKLLDWMAVAPDLNRLLCAVYFGNFAGGGKSLFAHGMAKLWTDGGPSKLDRILGNFNDDLVRCPLIFADEKTTSNKWQKDTITEDLREMVSINSRPLRRLYISTASLNGCIRLLMAANNEFLLRLSEEATARDLEALAERFLYIDVGKHVRDYIDAIPNEVIVGHWLQRGIAEYALWLQENRQVKPPERRFWVEGSVTSMHRMLMASSPWIGRVCEWVVRYLQKPQKVAKRKDRLIVREPGRLLVNSQAVIDTWQLYLPSQKRFDPDTARIGSALRALSLGKAEREHNGETTTYWEIDTATVADWSESNLIGNPQKIRKQFAA